MLDFEGFWVPTWGGQGGYSNALFELMLDLGAKMGQDSPKSSARDPQEPSKSCPRASKSPPRRPWGQICGRFLIDFGCIFGQCFVDLLSFLGTVAGMAEGNWIRRPRRGAAVWDLPPEPVSYTHLTLPTILLV